MSVTQKCGCRACRLQRELAKVKRQLAKLKGRHDELCYAYKKGLIRIIRLPKKGRKA